MLFPVSPDVLDRVQFRCIGRKVFHMNMSLQAVDVVSHQGTAVRRQAIPNQHQRVVDVPYQGRQEVYHLRRFHGSCIKPEVEVQRRQPSYCGKALPIEIVFQYRGLSPWCPGATTVRALAQSTLVDEDDRAPFLVGFFLILGQTFLRQV